tara:strand:- start:1092 stop:1853 length:762 start_codon:yes stop_codon:yes gene_type:complete
MSGTFAVTTNDNYSSLPYEKASSFRINNYTGKTVGIRPKHKTISVDNFEDLSNPEWTGTLNVGFDHKGLEGEYAAQIKDLAHRPITNQVVLDGSEVEVSFKTPDISGFNVKIRILDDITRLGIGYAAEYDKILTPGYYRVIFKLFPTQDIYTVFEEKDGGDRASVNDTIESDYGSNDMRNCIITFEASHDFLIDNIVYQQKVNYSNELLPGMSSVNYPCSDNTAEYEIINLGSDVLNYSDNTENISLSGFYES